MQYACKQKDDCTLESWVINSVYCTRNNRRSTSHGVREQRSTRALFDSDEEDDVIGPRLTDRGDDLVDTDNEEDQEQDRYEKDQEKDDDEGPAFTKVKGYHTLESEKISAPVKVVLDGKPYKKNPADAVYHVMPEHINDHRFSETLGRLPYSWGGGYVPLIDTLPEDVTIDTGINQFTEILGILNSIAADDKQVAPTAVLQIKADVISYLVQLRASFVFPWKESPTMKNLLKQLDETPHEISKRTVPGFPASTFVPTAIDILDPDDPTDYVDEFGRNNKARKEKRAFKQTTHVLFTNENGMKGYLPNPSRALSIYDTEYQEENEDGLLDGLTSETINIGDVLGYAGLPDLEACEE